MTCWPADAIVLGSYETGLGVVRALGRQGITVHVVDHQRLHAGYSRYATFHLCPHPASDPAGFCLTLRALAESLPAPPVLFIAADEYVLAVTRHREQLETFCRFNISSSRLLDCIIDKLQQVQLAIEHGIAVPNTMVVGTAADASMVIETMPLPAFIKGRNSVRWRTAYGGTVKGVVVETRDHLARALEHALEREVPVIVQEVITGDATQHMKVSGYVSTTGTVLAAFTLRKIRQQPHGFGVGCVVESIEHPVLLALGHALFERIGYRGTGSIEFKFDARDGVFKLIELNPRYWQQNSLAEFVGMNLPLLEYRDVLGLPVHPVKEFRTGVRWVNLMLDQETARQLWASGELTFMDWWCTVTGQRIWSDMSADDWGPGFWVLRQQLAKRWHRVRRAFKVHAHD